MAVKQIVVRSIVYNRDLVHIHQTFLKAVVHAIIIDH